MFTEKEKFEQIINWLEGTKETDVETLKEDLKRGIAIAELNDDMIERVKLIYDEIIEIVKAVYLGRKVVEKVVTKLY